MQFSISANFMISKGPHMPIYYGLLKYAIFIAREGAKPPSSRGSSFSRHMGTQMNALKFIAMVVEQFCKNHFSSL